MKKTWNKRTRQLLEIPNGIGIELNTGDVAIVDKNMRSIVVGKNWGARPHGKSIYVYGWIDKKRVALHQLVIGKKDGFCIDHINGNPLDNRRKNLRHVSWSENSWNRARGVNNTSGFKGVFWRRDRNRWLAGIRFNGKMIKLGLFIEKEPAAAAYDAAAKKFFGEFAVLNFPDSRNHRRRKGARSLTVNLCPAKRNET